MLQHKHLPVRAFWRNTIRLVAAVLLCTGLHGEPRPKVAVALGGGAALGLSHIGFLRWMEEHRIPIHAVAGTSMGGLIGGLYATGYTADEMTKFAHGIDWQFALESAPPYERLTLRRKEDRRQFPNSFELGLRGGTLNVPTGLSPGHGVGIVISSFTAPYGDVHDFDQLPTPFRCIATDLVSGEEVVFASGSLFDALRSTMSIPGFFAPWHVGNQVLVDGGMLNNLPTDIAKKMGADIVIAVELETPPIDKKTRFDLLKVASRSLSVMISNNERRHMALADILVMPDLRGFTSMDYARGEALMALGYAAAEQKARQLLPLALPEDEWAAYVAARAAKRKHAPAQADQLVLEGVGDKYKALIDRSAQKLGTLPTDAQELAEQVSMATETGRFGSADYAFVQRDGAPAIQVRMHDKEHGPPFLNTGILVDTNQRDGSAFGFGARMTMLDLGGPLSELRVDLNAGVQNRFATEYYWRPGSRSFFLAPSVMARTDSIPYFDGHYESGRLSSWEVRGGVDAGLALGRLTEVRFGYAAAHSNFRIASGSAPVSSFDGRWNLLHASFVRDATDAAVIPSRGLRTSVEALYSLTAPPGQNSGASTVDARMLWVHRFSAKYRVMNELDGGWSTHGEFVERPFMLGGSDRLNALVTNQMIGTRYYYASTMLMRALSKGTQPFYAVLRGEAGRAWFTGSANPFVDAALGVVRETVIGSVFVGFAVGESGERKIIFHLGRLF